MADSWNDFTSEVKKASGGRAPGCSFGAYLRGLGPGAREKVVMALAAPEYTTAAISAALRKRGAEVSDFTVGRHRRGVCSCPKNGQ